MTMELRVEVTRTLTSTVTTSTSLCVLVAWTVFVEVTVTLRRDKSWSALSSHIHLSYLRAWSLGNHHETGHGQLTREPRTSRPSTASPLDNTHPHSTPRPPCSMSRPGSTCPPRPGSTTHPRPARSNPRSRDTACGGPRSRSCSRSRGIPAFGARGSGGRSRALCRGGRARGLRGRGTGRRLSQRWGRSRRLARRWRGRGGVSLVLERRSWAWSQHASWGHAGRCASTQSADI